MAVEDHPLFSKWDTAMKKWRVRQEFYEALEGYDDSYPLKKQAKKAVEEAAAEVSEIVSQL
jgi:hypothetical protein